MLKKLEVLNKWRAIIDECKQSGLTKKAFCAQKGIKAYQLYHYEKSLRKSDSNPSVTNIPTLVPIRLNKPLEGSSTDRGIEFELKNGIKCKLPLGISKEHFQMIAEVLTLC